MKIKVFVDSVMQENSYIYYDEKTLEAVIIDPALCLEKEKKFIDDNKLNVKYIMLTHSHADHVADAEALKEYTGAAIIANKDEREMLIDAKKNLSSDFFTHGIEFEADKYVSEGDKIQLGNNTFTFIDTPGHTTGGMCIRFNNDLFTGDTLFMGSIGRTDLYGGNYDKMLKSLKKLSKLEDDLNIYPGHGPASTIGTEKASNYYMKLVI